MIAPPQAARFPPKNCFSPLGGLEAVSGGGPCPAEPARNTWVISQRCDRLRESSVKRNSAGRYKQTVGRNPPTLPPDEAYGSLNCGRSTPLPTSPLTPRVRVALVNADLPTDVGIMPSVEPRRARG